jgi:ABC-type Fe3+ transport system substrate-binding protein
MRRAALGVSALAAIVVVPFLLRPPQNVILGGDPVVVVTPHNEAIRYEFARGFQAHMLERRGRKVHIDWRTPGGTAEIARYVGSEYAAAFERHWRGLGRPWTSVAAASFANAKTALPDDPAKDGEAERARRAFLSSNVGIGIDVMFGGGSFDFSEHASAGRLIDAGVVRGHPEWFGDNAIPKVHAGEPYWDGKGRWIGACLTGFGICYNAGAVARLGILDPPERWQDLANPRDLGALALADPGQSGSANKAFEMILQAEMGLVQSKDDAAREGWARGLRLIRKIAANARYFTDSASRIPQDIAMGDAAAGMCIDFYGRFQGETATDPSRLVFVSPLRGTSIGTDPIGVMRGAPSPELARELVEFVLSPDGQKLWDFRIGTPGGPEKYALRRMPISPLLYQPPYAQHLADPDANPYGHKGLEYVEKWTSPLFRAIAFVIRSMCLDPIDELQDAWHALHVAGFPNEATSVFDDVSAVDYDTTSGAIRTALRSGDPADEMALATRLTESFRAQYRRAASLAREHR